MYKHLLTYLRRLFLRLQSLSQLSFVWPRNQELDNRPRNRNITYPCLGKLGTNLVIKYELSLNFSFWVKVILCLSLAWGRDLELRLFNFKRYVRKLDLIETIFASILNFLRLYVLELWAEMRQMDRQMTDEGTVSTPWVKKGYHPNHGYNFVNSWSICKILVLVLLQRAVNFQQNSH